MKRTLLLPLLVACAVAACNDETTTAEPQSAQEYQSLAVSIGDDYVGLACDAFTEGQAFCADDTTFVYCSLGVWWAIDCVDDLGADFCGEDDYYDTVDCYIWI